MTRNVSNLAIWKKVKNSKFFFWEKKICRANLKDIYDRNRKQWQQQQDYLGGSKMRNVHRYRFLIT